jgi:hypothetical protein
MGLRGHDVRMQLLILLGSGEEALFRVFVHDEALRIDRGRSKSGSALYEPDGWVEVGDFVF